MLRSYLFTITLLIGCQVVDAQSFAFGVKGGLTIGTQQWGNSFERDALFRYHGIAFIETLPDGNDFAILAQAGYHVKGSSIRTNFFTTAGDRRQLVTPFEFNNISLTLGGKKKYDVGRGNMRLFYMFGVRGEYTVRTNLGPQDLIEDNPYLARIYPFEGFVNKFTYGATVGGGVEVPLGDLVGMSLEFTVNPDFSNQYNQPQIDNVIDPNPNATRPTFTIPERQIRNLTFEVTAGFRFLRIVEYID